MKKNENILALAKEKINELSENDKSTLQKAKITGDWSSFKMIAVEDLIIPDYQRKQLKLDKLCKAVPEVGGFDLDFFGALNVTDLDNGSYDVDNGQRRGLGYLIKYILSNPDLDPSKLKVPCLVSSPKPYRKAAKLFWLYNGGAGASIRPSNEEGFHAQVEAELTGALKLKDLLVRAKLACGEVNKDFTDRQIAYVTLVKATEMGAKNQGRDKKHEDLGDEWVIKVADLFGKVWPERMDNQLFNGFTHLLNHYAYQDQFLKEMVWARFEKYISDLGKCYVTPTAYVKTLTSFKNTPDWSMGIALGILTGFAQVSNRIVNVGPLQKDVNKALGIV